MKKRVPIQHQVSILGSGISDSVEIRRIVDEQKGAYRTELYSNLNEFRSALSSCDCMAAILDLDSVALDNRTIRNLTLSFPNVCFLGVSRKHFNPELKDAICYHLFACLTKPIDPEELQYFLKCIRDDEVNR
jgi:hypothetical protein